MALTPALMPAFFGYDPWETRHRSLTDRDHFGIGMSPEEIRMLNSLPQSGMLPRLNDEAQDYTAGKDGFEFHINAKHFKPSEITVKSVDKTIIVEGKHDERKDKHGHITRQFVRKYILPDNYDPNEVISSLSSDGVLTVKAPAPKETPEGVKEKIVPIHHTGPAHLHIK